MRFIRPTTTALSTADIKTRYFKELLLERFFGRIESLHIAQKQSVFKVLFG